jgi:hypothetical protein
LDRLLRSSQSIGGLSLSNLRLADLKARRSTLNKHVSEPNVPLTDLSTSHQTDLNVNHNETMDSAFQRSTESHSYASLQMIHKTRQSDDVPHVNLFPAEMSASNVTGSGGKNETKDAHVLPTTHSKASEIILKKREKDKQKDKKNKKEKKRNSQPSHPQSKSYVLSTTSNQTKSIQIHTPNYTHN